MFLLLYIVLIVMLSSQVSKVRQMQRSIMSICRRNSAFFAFICPCMISLSLDKRGTRGVTVITSFILHTVLWSYPQHVSCSKHPNVFCVLRTSAVAHT